MTVLNRRKKRVRSILRTQSERYHFDAFERSTGLRYLSEKELDEYFDRLRFQKGNLILDVGSGSGRITERLSRMGAHVVALDLSETMLTETRSRVDGMVVEFVVGDVQHLPFKQKVFDRVVFARAIKYVPDYRTAIVEVSRVLADEGRAVIEVANKFSYLAVFARPLKLIRLLSRWEILEAAGEAGVVADVQGSFFHLAPRIYGRVNSRAILHFLVSAERVLEKVHPGSVGDRSLLVTCRKRAIAEPR